MVTRETIVPAFGLTTWIFFGLSVITVFVFLLGASQDCGSVEFCSATIFFLIFIGSLVMLILLGSVNGTIGSRLQGENNVRYFFMQDVTVGKLLWIPAGIVGVFAVSFFAIEIQEPLVGIFLSGLIMLVAFLRTNAILIPIIIHGFYNSAVVYFRSIDPNSLLSASPITVPEIGLTFPDLSQLASEIIFQNVLVAGSEEMFKVFIIAFVIVSTKGTFSSKGITKWIAGFIAVTVWAIYHTIVV